MEAANAYGFFPLNATDDDIEYFPVAATQTWVAGDMLYMVGGAVTIATAAAATLLGAAADNQTTPATGTKVPVYSKVGQRYRVRADDDASGLAPTAEIDIVGTTGIMEADVGASTTNVLVFLNIVDGQDATEPGAYLEVIINQSIHDLNQ